MTADRIEPCACGGVIVVGENATDVQVESAVVSHNRTRRHWLWRQETSRHEGARFVVEHGYWLRVA
jgi:hypothetical protein